ncbi:hypothetical protein BUALT_Bualt11G0062900 [Buddleja alternifolia]|uniref:Protein kinase domain-containing protein n=1 Tax=Buddleja alternifolia TaxID=168488 RepID=A0AAV6X080_9LAMI|nr:hypothetical protein BUALT_Bualt11G0062900 [Buddleja alternifolia]
MVMKKKSTTTRVDKIGVGICLVCLYRNKTRASQKFDMKGHIMSKSEGRFGSVYHGTLPDGEEVAVKVRSSTLTQGTRKINNEMNFLSAIQHENLVPLLGYCCENEQQILVYPFMSNGSLQDRLYGLTYLHTFSERCVIHRDVKSSNMLLDHSMCAKVADFGFSKYAPQEGDSGTSLKAKPHIRNSKVEEIVGPSVKGSYHAEAMWRVVEVALACTEPYSVYRPCMADIVCELEDAFIIENNVSKYMKSIESFGGSNRYSIERPIVITPTPVTLEASPILVQPPPPQPR